MNKADQGQYYSQAKVTCACGNEFAVGSTKSEIRVDICSACHPFFTGQMKYVDTGGRVKRFEDRLKQIKKRPVKSKKKGSKDQSSSSSVKTLKEMLEQAK
ncbi:MAG: 50S ribosomal protein L31 [Candidatus Shapirobacteria bacterium]|nr:50S ribosomal protein L31 [Candidatus Shapirobacteria bacterium]MDD5073758.1 50S ribosomal protein L31 [Candidatus Shapirobacteria bacterium]MDD5481641.1 50S ribosomal protein L31 [Candidatus Shapirobacteria bacterium]